MSVFSRLSHGVACAAIAVTSLGISCAPGRSVPLVLVDSIYAVANSLEDVRKIDIEENGRAHITVIRDLANPVPEIERALERGNSRVLVSPYLADAAKSLAPEYPNTLFGLIGYRDSRKGDGTGKRASTQAEPDNTVELILVREGAMEILAERIAEEINISGDGELHLLGIWQTLSEWDREELELFRKTLSRASGERFDIEIRAAEEESDFGELETFLREEITDKTVLGICFAGWADVRCARVFWEYGIPIVTEGLEGDQSVWGPVAYTVFHDLRRVLRHFITLDPVESPSSVRIQASVAPREE